MKLKTGWIVLFGVLVTVAAAALGLARRQSQSFEWVELKRGPIVESVFGLATVTAGREFQLKLGIVTTLRALHVTEGQRVEAGAPLVTLDDSGVRRAPFRGTITSLPYRERETVFPQTPLLTLTDLTDRYLTLALEQQGALRVKPGQKASVAFESLRGQKFEGAVRTLFPKEGQFLVFIDVANLPEEVLPGMTADVAIEVSRKEEAILIPLRAVQNGQAWIEASGTSTRTPLTLGTLDTEWAEVLSPAITLPARTRISRR